jgi:hypothetical protein
MAMQMERLATNLNLPRWRKLYHASIPWVGGFGPEHFDIGNTAPNRPLPPEYARPNRKFGAFDFVQIADPNVSALALVSGDRRIIERFAALGDDFCARVQTGAGARSPGPSGSRTTGRMLAGQFAEPNNRWLMPFLHVHARVLNFTSFSEAPDRLECIDSSSLARAGQKAKLDWTAKQAAMLSELGYRVAAADDRVSKLRVDGVCPRLLAAIEAPRIAVMRLLERTLVGDRPPSVERLRSELPPAVIAAMAEQLESLLARSLSFYKPPKIGIPSEGPWRNSVREHLSHYCPGSLELLDRTALRAKAAPIEAALFPTPPLDSAHWHAPAIEFMDAVNQLPTDAELGVSRTGGQIEHTAPAWLAREFEKTLLEVNERIVRSGPDDPLVELRGMLATIDNISEGADPSQLKNSALLISAELERKAKDAPEDALWDGRQRRAERPPLVSLEELFEDAALPRLVCEQEIGGRSL